MIDFNNNDYNLDKIRKESKLFNLITKWNYRIVGLKLVKNNDPIGIYFSANHVPLPDIKPLVKLFNDNGMSVDFNTSDIESKDKVYLGLRKDVREIPLLSGAILQTIIYYLENKLTIDPSFIFPRHPVFYKSVEEKEEEEEETEE